MPRPKKCRRVGFIPEIEFFIPSDKKETEGDEVVLTIEELEAVRLSDLEGFEQDKSAESMSISRGTLQRILNSGRRKIADALVNGKTICITGGNYIEGLCAMTCKKCNCTWDNTADVNKGICPKCGNTEIYCCKKDKKCSGSCHRQNE